MLELIRVEKAYQKLSSFELKKAFELGKIILEKRENEIIAIYLMTVTDYDNFK